VTVGSDVRMSGIKIGTVASQELNSNTYSANLALFIRADVRLPDDTSAKVAAEGLLGGNYIALTAGGSETMLADGDEISYTQGTVDLLSLVGQALFNPQNNATDSQ
ncbi:MAG: MlaD family protein, partial [Alphaproteobacteria bacterium]|nr:MlaD family protein [Alphaproteobacteria bacterium]